MVTRYDVDFVADAIKESKPIICVACEERFEIVLHKINAAEQPRALDGVCTCPEYINEPMTTAFKCAFCGKPPRQ